MRVRKAERSDIERVEAIDAVCFPPDDPVLVSATPGELRDAVEGATIYVAENEGQVRGFIHWVKPTERHVYLATLAVEPSEQGAGIGALLLDQLIRDVASWGSRQAISFSTVTSPENWRMIGLLLGRGFIVRGYVDDYFGTGRDRLYLQYKALDQRQDPDSRFLVPVTSREKLRDLLADDHVATALVDLPFGPAFEVSRFIPEDLAGLESDEGASSQSFSGSLLAAITFLLGFTLVSDSGGGGVGLLLTFAALVTTISMVVYANASGEVSRLRNRRFEAFVRIGNLLSEYGGVFPLLICLPVMYARASEKPLMASLVAVAFGLSLAWYSRSEFSIAHRRRNTAPSVVLHIGLHGALCIAPVVGALVYSSDRSAALELAWATSVLVLLAVTVAMVARVPEASNG